MKYLKTILKFIPYLYFIFLIIYWFLETKNNEGSSTYLLLFLIIPFVWQLIKANKIIDIILGVLFICLSSYLVLAYLSNLFKMKDFANDPNHFIIIGGFFVLSNLFMSALLIRNSIKAGL